MGKNKQIRREANKKTQVENSLAMLLECNKKHDVVIDQIGKIKSKISSLQRTNRVSEISSNYIIHSTDDAATYYTQLGRCFQQTPTDTLLRDLKNSQTSANEDLPKLLSTLKQFEKLKDEQQTIIKELTNTG